LTEKSIKEKMASLNQYIVEFHEQNNFYHKINAEFLAFNVRHFRAIAWSCAISCATYTIVALIFSQMGGNLLVASLPIAICAVINFYEMTRSNKRRKYFLSVLNEKAIKYSNTIGKGDSNGQEEKGDTPEIH
jgi:hypothetical protein